MHRKLATTFMFLAIFGGTALSQEVNKRIALASNSTVPSVDIIKNLEKKCPNVKLTINPANSSFTLEAKTRNNAHNRPDRYEFTLFDKNGDSVFSTKTHRISNAVKDVCNAINGTGKAK